MRRTVRTTVLASTAAIAAAVGAVALAPVASAQEDETPPPPAFGSSLPESPDLVVSVAAVCVDRDAEDEETDQVAALEIKLANVGPGDASNVTTNFAVFPDAPGVINEEVVEAGAELTYTVPSELTEWVSRPAGAAVFSPQLDVNYTDNIAFGVIGVNCAPVVEDDTEE